MVDLEELKPTLTSDSGKVVYYETEGCYVIPLRFFLQHLRIDNLEFKIPPEMMIRNYRVTTRFCGEFLYELVGHLHDDNLDYPDFVMFNTKLQKWFKMIPPEGVIGVRFGVNCTRVKAITNQYFYEWTNWKKAKISAPDEFRYNAQFLDLCKNCVPFRLKSRAPINGEANAILFDVSGS